MDYISKIKAATSLEDLYRLREEFRGVELECNLASKGPGGIDINGWSEASFHRNAVEKQIAYLETKGVFLADVIAGGGDGLKAENSRLNNALEAINAIMWNSYMIKGVGITHDACEGIMKVLDAWASIDHSIKNDNHEHNR